MEAKEENRERRAERKVDPATRKIQERISQGGKEDHPDAGGKSGKVPLPGDRKAVGYGADTGVNGHMGMYVVPDPVMFLLDCIHFSQTYNRTKRK